MLDLKYIILVSTLTVCVAQGFIRSLSLTPFLSLSSLYEDSVAK